MICYDFAYAFGDLPTQNNLIQSVIHHLHIDIEPSGQSPRQVPLCHPNRNKPESFRIQKNKSVNNPDIKFYPLICQPIGCRIMCREIFKVHMLVWEIRIHGLESVGL